MPACFKLVFPFYYLAAYNSVRFFIIEAVDGGHDTFTLQTDGQSPLDTQTATAIARFVVYYVNRILKITLTNNNRLKIVVPICPLFHDLLTPSISHHSDLGVITVHKNITSVKRGSSLFITYIPR